MSKPNVAGPIVTEKGPTDFGGLIGTPESVDVTDVQDSYPVPPPIPVVSRETGSVETSRTEDIGQLDGWVESHEPTEGHDWNNGPDYPRPNKNPARRHYGDEVRTTTPNF